MRKLEVKNGKLWAGIFLGVMVVIIVYLSFVFLGQHEVETLYPSEYLTEKKMLSDYYPGLKDTPCDTEVYIFRGEKPGSSMLVVGGTHPSEPAGIAGAVLITENVKVTEGTLFVIPRLNMSGLTCTEPQDAAPLGYEIETPTGTRFFRMGSRLVNPVDQWPDPDIYYHNAGQLLTGKETRNIDRCYPGSDNAGLTEKICYGVIELIKAENIDMEVDLHEGPPEYPTIDVMIAHQNAMDLGGAVTFNMAFEGLTLSVDASPENLHGFSHREIGDATDCMAMLAETVNTLQGRLTSRKTSETIIDGQDKFYSYAGANTDRLFTDFDDSGKPLTLRVGRHVELVQQIALSYNELGLGKNLVIENLPSYDDIMTNGLGVYMPIK